MDKEDSMSEPRLRNSVDCIIAVISKKRGELGFTDKSDQFTESHASEISSYYYGKGALSRTRILTTKHTARFNACNDNHGENDG